MKTCSPGLSDSIASVIHDPRRCPHCDSSSQIAGGLCVGCLLEAGLDPADDADSEELSGLLSQINLPDQNWRLGNYEILEEIGRGGMGVIYRARQRHSRRIVAVKRVLSYHADSRETLARFRREAQAAASLDHPNILPIYEVSESEDGLPFFSMKFAPGGTLQQVAPALRNDPRQCVALVAKIARAVQYAHSRGILHRDLKPGNILLDGRGEPLVSDFGLAKWLDTTSDLTRTLTIFGTPGYIAPEQATHSAAELKPTADIYSLGAILFDLLAGRPPFLGAHALSVIRQASEATAPKLRTLSKLADRDLETVCARCLEREPAGRYHSSHDLAEDLERWLEGRPIVARRTSPPTRLYRWSKRNPVLAVAVSASTAFAIIAGAGLLTTSRLGTVIRNHEIALHSVVVTPFEDLDTLSMTSSAALEARNTITEGLQKEKSLHVASSALQLSDITIFSTPDDWKRLGRIMGATKILTGTTRTKDGGRRIVFRVIDASSGAVVARSVSNVSATRDDWQPTVKLAAARILSVMQEGGEKKIDGESTIPAAREYLRTGKEYYYRYNPADTRTSQSYFAKAVEADPECAEAQAMLALSWSRCFQQNPDQFSEENYAKAVNAANKAVEMNPELAVAYRAQAALLYRTDPAASYEPALCALELEPDDTFPAGLIGLAWRMRGRPDLALQWLQRSARGQRPGMNSAAIGDAFIELQQDDKAEQAYRHRLEFWPDVPDAHVGLARLWMYRRDFGRARQQSEEALARYPDHFYARQLSAVIKLFERNFPGAEQEYKKLAEADRHGGVAFYCCISNLSALGFLRMQANDIEEAKKLLTEARDYQLREISKTPKQRELLYDLAATYAAMNEREEAFDAFHRAVASGWIDGRAPLLDPRFDSIRNDRRFATILNYLAAKIENLGREKRQEENWLKTKQGN